MGRHIWYLFLLKVLQRLLGVMEKGVFPARKRTRGIEVRFTRFVQHARGVLVVSTPFSIELTALKETRVIQRAIILLER